MLSAVPFPDWKAAWAEAASLALAGGLLIYVFEELWTAVVFKERGDLGSDRLTI
jgi:hypothetical protein